MECDTRDTHRIAPGKLRAAARCWVGGGESSDETDAALAAFGIKMADEKKNEPLAVFYFNWQTLSVFISTWNQWNVVAVTELVRIGMNWSEVESSLKLSGVKRCNWPEIFEGLQVMQTEVLTIYNERLAENNG
jgi:hypothetical protein